MDASHSGTDKLTRGLARPAIMGAMVGAVASLAMAMYAMIAAATYQGTGFFTPLYHIASVFIEPKTMMTSMQHGMADSTFYFVFGPAVLGAVIHMMVGYGTFLVEHVMFGLALGLLYLNRRVSASR